MAVLPIQVKTSGITQVETLTSKIQKLENQQSLLTRKNIEYKKQLQSLSKEDKDYQLKKDKLTASIKKNSLAQAENTQDIKESKKELIQLNKQVELNDKANIKSTNSTNKLANGFKAIAVGALVYITIDKLVSSVISLGKSFISTADDMTLANSRLSLVTKNTEEFASAQESLFSVAQDARVELTTTIDLYSQMARSTSELNITQDRLLNVTSNISKALTISGGSAESANAAIFQLNQGFASGTLRGEELNSVLEQTPRLAQAIADGLGITVGQLRAVAAEGKLTTETVITALESQTIAIESEFGKIATTVEQSNLLMENSSKKAIASLNEQFEITKSIAKSFTVLSMAGAETFSILSEGFGDSTESSVWFAEATLTGMKWLITATGDLYDRLEVVGDIFSLLGNTGAAAFYGLVSAASFAAAEIGDLFQNVTNSIISMINVAISGVNLLGANIGKIEKVDFKSTNSSNAKEAASRAIKFSGKAAESLIDLATPSTIGRDTAKILTDEIDFALEELISRQATESVNSTTKTPTENSSYSNKSQDEFLSVSSALAEFGDTFSNIDLQEIKDAYSNNSDIANEVDEILRNRLSNSNSDNTFNINDEIKKQEEYTKKMLEDMDTTREVTKDTSESIKDTSEALEEFNDILTNDKSNVYDNVGNITDSFNDFTKSANNADYAIEKVIDSLDDFIFQFSDTLFNSIENNISKLNQIGQDTAFTSISYSEALNKAISARNDLVNNPLDVGIGEVYTNAYNQFVSSASDYLSDPTSFESSQDYAFARSTVGLQAEQFRGTADTTVDVLESMNNFLSTINQAFADGILSDEEKATIAGVAGEVNEKLVGSNSVKTVLDSFMGKNSEGISINGLVSGVNALSVATGLDVSELSNLSSIATSTGVMTDGDSIGLNNLQLESTRKEYYAKDMGDGVTSLDNYVETYTYYDKGGFTGYGQGKKDHTGFKQAGIVHEGEYVAPKWMVDSQPAIFRELENARLNKGFANGGYTTPTVYNNNIQENNSDMQLQLLTRVTNIETILNRVSEGGDTIGVRLVG